MGGISSVRPSEGWGLRPLAVRLRPEVPAFAGTHSCGGAIA
jgi:hypothetical protein